MAKHATPKLDQLESGPWPSFVSDIKQEAEMRAKNRKGWGAWSAVDQLFFAYVPGFTEEVFANVQAKYEKWNVWVVFTAAFTPIPFKVFTIAAGVFGINFVKFTLAAVVGRSARFFLVAGLLYWFGEPIRKFIDKWFNLLTLLFTIIFIGSFVILKYM